MSVPAMDAAYAMALVTGLLGGAGHCAGMCGPIVGSLGMSAGGGILGQALYNAGRIATYTILGAVMGAAGSFAAVAARMEGAQQWVMVGAGALMAFMGLSVFVSGGSGGLLGVIERRNAPVLRAARRLMGARGVVLKFLPLGLVMGLLPCGLSYTVLVAAAGTGSPVKGGLTMLCFGIGTAPSLMAVGLIVKALGARARGWVYRSGGLAVLFMGCWFVYKGFHAYL